MGKRSSTQKIIQPKHWKEHLTAESTVDLAIVVVSYNTTYHLKRCLLSLKNNPLSDGSSVVVVVDNASTDGSPQMIRKKFPWAYRIENDENLGFARGCNQGIRAIDAKYYLLFNSDAASMGNALDVMVSFMDANPDIGAAGGLTFTEDGVIQPSTLVHPNYWNLLFSRASLLAKLPVFRWKMEELRKVPDDITDVPALAGGFLILRAEAIEEVGLLDERFFLYLEDIDICRRLRKAGWRVVFNPNARILHSWGASSNKRRTKAFWWHHMSMFRYFQKHYPYLLPINLLLGFGLVTHFGMWWTFNSLTGWRSFKSADSKNAIKS